MNPTHDSTDIARLADVTHQALVTAIDNAADAPEPDHYVDTFGFADGRGYSTITPTALTMEHALTAIGDDMRMLYNRHLLACRLRDFDVAAGTCRLPASVVALYPRDLARIAAQVETMGPDYFRLDKDTFVKDLAILSHRLIPVGAEYVFPNSGVPLSLLLRKGPTQLIKGLRACVFDAGGFRPYFELHAHVLALQDFNPDGWDASYQRMAELLQLNPHIRGIVSSSWFLDPALTDVSPRLAYLREVPEAHGATLMFSSVDKEGCSGALSKSATRRKLFDEGAYVPTIYTRIWP
ncbi:MAG: hypothetical protein KDJ24_16565, partial [Gammaproteobacteria bacterium]|nr:hypothetical protein [Gammaproteobacteria bacterium]